ncbi:hypothetical protein [Tunturiibacter gelidiferens]|uniref:hypothetical protein n=1 Tax=Tunturiibacter gelidiferens TaxID=3069689 RepID=UPI003D9BCB57
MSSARTSIMESEQKGFDLRPMSFHPNTSFIEKGPLAEVRANLQVAQNKYFVNKPPAINILQAPAACKLMKIKDFAAGYPGGGEGQKRLGFGKNVKQEPEPTPRNRHNGPAKHHEKTAKEHVLQPFLPRCVLP